MFFVSLMRTATTAKITRGLWVVSRAPNQLFQMQKKSQLESYFFSP